MNRRSILVTSSAIALPALAAIAACTVPPAGTTPAVQTVFNDIQFILPLVDALAFGISIAVPSSAALVAAATPYLNSAAPIFQTLSATMTQVQAMPIVQQIEGYLSGAVKAVAGVVNGAPAGSQLAAFAPKVQQAQAALALVTAFVNGVTAMPTAAMAPLPLLHR